MSLFFCEKMLAPLSLSRASIICRRFFGTRLHTTPAGMTREASHVLTKSEPKLAHLPSLDYFFFNAMKPIREGRTNWNARFVRHVAASRTTHALVLAVLVASPSYCLAADSLDAVEKAAGEWIKLRTETARIESDWERERALVESMIQAVNQRATVAAEKRDLALAKTAKEREEIEAMRAKNHTEQDELKAADTRLKAQAQKLLALRPHLPPRLSEALEMAYRTLASAELPTGDRMQYVTMILNRCAQFNRLVSVGEDVLTLDGEPPAKSYEVIYWGMSHGYAIDRSGKKSWLGSPTESGWKWEPKPEAFNAVVELVAIANDKADPSFVVVPASGARALPEYSNP